MTTFNLGERAVDRYVRDVAAATTGSLSNGYPVSANRLEFARSNAAHLCLEGCRNLVQSDGRGTVSSFQTVGNIWNGALVDEGSASASFNLGAAIPWDPRVAECFGDYPMVADRLGIYGQPVFRSVRFSIEMTVDATNTSSKVFFAMTGHADPVQLAQGNFYALSVNTIATSGHQTLTITLSCERLLAASMFDRWTCRQASYAYGSTQALVLPVNLWFGWQFLGTGTGNAIHKFEAWESRIDPP